MLAHAPGEEQVAPLRLGRLPDDDLHPLAVVDVAVALLDEQAAEHALVVALAAPRRAALAVGEDPRAPACAQRRERVVVVAGRVQHLDELLGEPRAERGRRRGG